MRLIVVDGVHGVLDGRAEFDLGRDARDMFDGKVSILKHFLLLKKFEFSLRGVHLECLVELLLIALFFLFFLLLAPPMHLCIFDDLTDAAADA